MQIYTLCSTQTFGKLTVHLTDNLLITECLKPHIACGPDASISPIYKKSDRSNPAGQLPVSLLEHGHNEALWTAQYPSWPTARLQEGEVLWNPISSFSRRPAEDCWQPLVDRGQADLVIMDFRKAFDTVPHRRLLANWVHHVGMMANLQHDLQLSPAFHREQCWDLCFF